MKSTQELLLHELELAHRIIQNALGIMDTAQKFDWMKANEESGCAGEGATRANEREAVIRLAAGQASSESAR